MDWAQRHGRILFQEPIEELRGEDAPQGGEHTVIFDEPSNRVIKLTKPGFFGAQGEDAFGKPLAQEVHKRYAWAVFPDGETKHVLLSVIRWKGESIQSDTAYSVESVEVQEKAAEGNFESRPAAARQASVTRQGLAITDTSIAADGDTGNLAQFLSGFKQEHRF